jgi:sialidase-1
VNVSEVKGWRIDPDWTPRDSAGTRAGFVHVPMLVGDTPGEESSFAFEGTAVGIFVAAGPDAGTVEFQLDGGAWRKQNLFTSWSATLHIPWAYVLDADLSEGRHELAMRVSADADPKSTGHAVRMAHLLCN